MAGYCGLPISVSRKAFGAAGHREEFCVLKLLLALLASALSGLALGESASTLYKASDWPDTPTVVAGRASFYGKRFTGRKTASGKHFHHEDVSAASNRFPLGTMVAVRRPSSALCIVVRINDRMGRGGRVIDLSRAAAEKLGMIEVGVTDVEIVRLPKPLIGHERACTLAFAPPVRLPAAEGLVADSDGDAFSADSLAGGVGVR
ncbi:septal ring lytic transglycosylase RlpA family protein [Candidatus Accumulibacter sp. ACC003]|uniref:septal ring lytic transglycosylase RlpA family protein n=1 Tax=Candidatus Accumulibacter sp. ACC003 TaxID=2823334 RepID=UPI0025C06780|nr:septal ring lytic transglycosylase RlpA family protein [Candidatus Accumulibacter sp. ACC003]